VTYSTPLRSGNLNREVVVEQRSTTKDTSGQQLDVWTQFCKTRAQIEQMSGAEVVSAGAQLGETMHQVIMRYRPGIRANMRLTYQGRILDILSVLDDFSQHRKLTLLCKEGLSRG
jgi:SPP1 family predicted phage head-tail adaptor